MNAMLVASHPEPVRRAIDTFRRALDAEPETFLMDNNRRLTENTREAAGRYFNVLPSQIALTDSTTMGIGLVYNGLKLRLGQEILTTRQDYYVTHEAVRLAALRTGATVRHVNLYDDISSVSEEQLTRQVLMAIAPQTRVLALTWVHSSTGLKMPIRRIADGVAAINVGRNESDHLLICLDGAHGVGNQDLDFDAIGADFVMTGAHKWLFGPRGTGVVIGNSRAWQSCLPIIPSFLDNSVLSAWVTGTDIPPGDTTAARMTAGGFKPFEHVWALANAFEWHQSLGRARIKARTDELATQLKAGLSMIDKVRLHTPVSQTLSAGIVAFTVDGMTPRQTVDALRSRNVVASVAPYATPYARLSPSIYNSPQDVDTALAAVRQL